MLSACGLSRAQMPSLVEGSAVHAYCHALPDRWHQMSVMLSAASALRWATQLTGRESEASLLGSAEALSQSQRSSAPLFLPYLAGERTPHNDPNAKGVLFGLTHEHGPGDVAYAVVEGVSYGLLDGFNSLDMELRSSVRELSLVGGGARSSYWAQLLATLLQRPLILRAGSETAAALGAARLAWMADGGEEREVCRTLPERNRFEPDPSPSSTLHARYQRFARLYPQVRSLWTERHTAT